jgi:DNA polymerase-3 subunit gamma/tau
MKDAIDLIERLRAQGVELLLAGDNIRFRGPGDALTPELRDRLKQHRAEIIAHLRQEIVRTGQGGLVVRRGDGDFTQIYRPCRISEMAGNDEARRIITNAFGQKRVPHSFLFHGLSGTGKTTMARIIEMGLNCKQGPTSEPCCVCFCCRRIIARKGSMAVIELNSVEKVMDDFREILKNFDAQGCGAVFDGGRSNILLIDECHGLTKDQAQLFLKYVEDVTEDNYYIFCTTAPDKFLPTLRDRCAMNLEFKHVLARDLMNLLINICYLEQLKPNEDVLRRIIEHSEGKPRVAVRELQQRYYAGDLGKITSPEITPAL